LTTWAQHPYSTGPFSLIQQSPPIWISYSTPYSNLTAWAQHPYSTGPFSLIQLNLPYSNTQNPFAANITTLLVNIIALVCFIVGASMGMLPE
jgi:hypothetical protein